MTKKNSTKGAAVTDELPATGGSRSFTKAGVLVSERKTEMPDPTNPKTSDGDKSSTAGQTPSETASKGA